MDKVITPNSNTETADSTWNYSPQKNELIELKLYMLFDIQKCRPWNLPAEIPPYRNPTSC